MGSQSNIHFYVNWAKERLDEMEATLTSLEGKAGEVQAEARDKADKVLASLQKKRDEFRDTIQRTADTNEAAWITPRPSWKSKMGVVQTEVLKYVDSFGKQVEQQQALYKSPGRRATERLARSRRRAWRRCRGIRRRASGWNHRRREAYECRCRRRGGKIPATEPGRNQAWSALMAALAETARGLRSRESGGAGSSDEPA